MKEAHRFIEPPLHAEKRTCPKPFPHFPVFVEKHDGNRIHSLFKKDLAAFLDVIVLLNVDGWSR
jgi:hypothetical protein